MSFFALVFGAAAATVVPQNQLNFVGCPVVRDVEPPCWLVEHEGELYFLGVQSALGYDFNPPQLKHKILVEATVSAESPVCGGRVLKPVAVSVLEELSPECNTILPADGYKPPPSIRVTGPRANGVQMATDPRDWKRGPDEYVQPPLPAPPYKLRRYDVYFDFDTVFMYSKTTKLFTQAFNYAKGINASSVEINGFRGASSLSDGTLMVERPDIAQRRANTIARYLVDLGLAPSLLKVSWKDEPEPSDGITDPFRRRVTIVIKP